MNDADRASGEYLMAWNESVWAFWNMLPPEERMRRQAYTKEKWKQATANCLKGKRGPEWTLDPDLDMGRDG